MTLVSIVPIPARVRWDRESTQPTRIEWADSGAGVLALRAVRDERHAYPSGRGPRLTLDVETQRGRIVVSWRPQQRRWFLEALEEADAAA